MNLNKTGIIVIGIVFLGLSLIPWGMFINNLLAFIKTAHAISFMLLLSPAFLAIVADIVGVVLIVNTAKSKEYIDNKLNSTQNQKYCTKCNNVLDKNQEICPKCGASVGENEI